jgi:WD40 repeat protein
MRVDIVDKFCPSSSKVSCYTFFKHVSDHYDVLYLGMENGKVFYLSIPTGQIPHNIRPVDATKDAGTQHTAEVRCLLFTNNKKFTSAASNGLLFSGSLDRSIKVWSMTGGNQSTPVQTLFGHSSTITNMVDGADGSVLSCSEDGSLRMWCPQRGRNMMLHPFFECTFTLSFGRDVWITTLTIGILGPWICYAADSEGSIEVLKKGSEGNDAERHVAAFTHQLTRFTKWEKVHTLGITHLELVREENILVSLSYDGTCKVLDPATGQILFQIANKRRCMYTGATWVKHLTSFYLIDEFGLLDVFNLYHERVIETVELSSLSSKQASNVLKCHANQALCDISSYSQDGYFLSMLASHDVKGAISGGSSSGSGAIMGGKSTVRLKSVGVIGDVVLWNLSNDINCMEFVGHEGSVVGISVPSFTAASASRTHTVDAEGNLTSMVYAPAAPRTAHGTAISAVSASHHHVMRASTLQISSNEKLFFSAGHEDGTLRCWDEYDQAETYQFKSKGISEITVMLAVWHMNRIVTGHENGTVCIWNADTGARVVSRALKHTVSSLVEAASAHSKLLLGADYSGKVVTWNLTLHYLNPTQLIQVGGDLDGFHNRDDPGILSLCFHDRTKTIFSGGNDTTVRFWRLHSDTVSGSSCTHKQSVSLLRCTGSFLLSGDEDGFLHLCRIMVSAVDDSVLSLHKPGQEATPCRAHRYAEHSSSYKQGRASSPGSASLPTSYYVSGLSVLCSWNTYPISMRALGDMCELDLTARNGSAFGGGKRIIVAHVGPAGSGRTRVWEVWTQKRSSVASQHRTHRAAGGFEGLRNTAAQLQQELADSLAGSLASPGGSQVLGGGSVVSGPAGHPGPASLAGSLDGAGPEDWEEQGASDSQGKYRIFEDQNPDLYISVSELYCLDHDKYEISCCTLANSDSIAFSSTASAAAAGTNSAVAKSAGSAQTPAAAVAAAAPVDALDRFRQSVLIYMGTSAGLIFRFSFKKLS